MSVSLICPHCGTPVIILKPPVTTCSNCQGAWPDGLRLSAEGMLEREKVGRPMLLTIGMYVAPAVGGMLLLMVLFALLNLGDYSIDGERVSGIEFLQLAGVFYVAVGGSSVAAAYAIWRERSWSRWAIVVFWIAQVAGAIGFGWARAGVGGAAAGLASLLIFVILVLWYLFDKENVVGYYRSLEKLEAAEEARRSAQRASLGASR